MTLENTFLPQILILHDKLFSFGMGAWLNDQRCFTKAFINALTKRTYDSNAEISEQYLWREFYLRVPAEVLVT